MEGRAFAEAALYAPIPPQLFRPCSPCQNRPSSPPPPKKHQPHRNERRAFLDPYAQFARFSDGNGALLLDEFLDAKETVAALSAEYEACEHADYVSGLYSGGYTTLGLYALWGLDSESGAWWGGGLEEQTRTSGCDRR